MAFLALLERLNPTERAVFILREVFDYEYKEIAEILSQNEVNCRQILRRARQHLATMRPRFTALASRRNELLESFVRASGTGDLKALITMLAEDVVLYSDGGGKAFAVPNPIYGAANVARAIAMGGSKFHPKEPVVSRRMSVNGTPGVVTYLAGRPLYVLTIDIRGEHISSIYFVTNPDKLTHIPGLDEQVSTPSDSAMRIA